MRFDDEISYRKQGLEIHEFRIKEDPVHHGGHLRVSVGPRETYLDLWNPAKKVWEEIETWNRRLRMDEALAVAEAILSTG